MYRTYPTVQPRAEVFALAKEITSLVIDSAVTYQAAIDALSAAQEMLMQTTKPVSVEAPQARRGLSAEQDADIKSIAKAIYDRRLEVLKLIENRQQASDPPPDAPDT